MRHALLSRFQGTLLAAALGNELGVYSRSRQAIPQSRTDASGQQAWLSASLAGWHPGLESEGLSDPSSFGGRAAISCARTLVEAGGWHERDLAAIGVPAASQFRTGVATGLLQPGRSLREPIAAALAIATLPVALFFHDDESRQQQRLLQTVKLWHCPPGAEAGLLAVGYAIAQALQDRLEPQTLLPQTIAYLKQSTANPTTPLLELTGTLEQAQTLVQRGAGLYTAIERLVRDNHAGSGAIALAFYCFLTTPDDLRLSLLRAARCGESAPVIGALTGALSGSHQGMSGLPLAWQSADASFSSWSIAEALLRQLATHLFAAWSGVYAPTMPMDVMQMDVAAIAAPGVIRPR